MSVQKTFSSSGPGLEGFPHGAPSLCMQPWRCLSNASEGVLLLHLFFPGNRYLLNLVCLRDAYPAVSTELTPPPHEQCKLAFGSSSLPVWVAFLREKESTPLQVTSGARHGDAGL